MRALRKSVLVIMTTWAMCAFTAPPAYASAQIVTGVQIAVPA